ncbi:RNB-domain-containing protein [Aureobasidium sp. EXF-12298]|nr:RNB-domain-containing protein [Aureobasidium sp. EXF-12298]
MLSLRSDAVRRGPDLAKMCWSCATKHDISPTSTRSLRSHLPAYDPVIQSLDQLESPDKPRRGYIRDQLRKWHEENAHLHTETINDYDVDASGEQTNNFTRLGDVDNFRRPDEDQENERDDSSRLISPGNLEDWDPHHRFLRKGDLVLLDFPRSEREPILAVFVRRVGQPSQSQFYTLHGKWVHGMERNIQHAVPDFVPPTQIDPIIPYLPDQGITEELLDKAQMFDLSVPRHVSAPLITKMLEFQRTSEEIYRQNATALDGAHHSLAHPTDLKFGTLELVADRLLGKDKDATVSQEKIYAVRKALSRGGFAFGHDRRSHRITGFIQIRSKEQVANVEKVRNWLRAWQDDLATFAAGQSSSHQFSQQGQYVVNFIHKAQSLIQKSREHREVTSAGRVGISKTRFDINKEDVIQYDYTTDFDDYDRELIRFFEGWACSGLFLGLPRIEALPPLILQATGMYEEHRLDPKTAFTFLQEIGVLTPHENRVRFDSHLLLPSSQHSKPLEQLMTRVMSLSDAPGFKDSMAHLRKDWGDLPVFCIDGEGAHEIDDGVSVEDAGQGEHWVHVHIANPTAFFDHDNPLAKMARHMTETIYMPERAFVMLPRWSTRKHFSLRADRPVLTFSARLNAKGETMEQKIQPGFIRNVKFIAPAEAARLVGVAAGLPQEVVLRVGGELPPRVPKKTGKSLLEHEIGMLKKLQILAEKRQTKRRMAGGLFLDTNRPEINVWHNARHAGLPWEHPSRMKARYVEGDPIIEYRTKALSSWFSSGEGVSDILVRELMLLACEIGASWCAERGIPIINRGTIVSPDTNNAEKFYDEVLAPAAEKNNGEAPMHLAIEYLKNSGSTILTTRPLHHQVLGISHYSKATSPLRRYGDMLLHWQIEAALREEAKAGGQLNFEGKNQQLLPFSNGALSLIAKGLQPRESMIRRATTYAEEHWQASVFFRAHHYNECELPATMNAYIHMQPATQRGEFSVIIKEFSMVGTLSLPERFGLGEAKAGDTWECEIEEIDVFGRKILFKPLRLVNRWEG